MLIYLVKAKSRSRHSFNQHDTLHAVVVRANRPEEVRKVAADVCGDEGPEPWMDAKPTTCICIGHAVGKRPFTTPVVLRDFNAG